MDERYRDDERAPEIFEVRATRIDGRSGGGPSRRWRPPWSIVLIGLLAVVVPAVAFVGPRIEWRPEIDLSFLRPTPGPSPTPTPRPTPRPTAPIPTELPELTWGEGERPTEPLPIDLNGLRFVEPETGALTDPAPIRATEGDAVFADDATGGWWCICLNRRWESSREIATLTVKTVDRRGRLTGETGLLELESSTDNGMGDYGLRIELERSPDDRIVWIGLATRQDDVWTLRLVSVDRIQAAILHDVVLASLEVDPPVDQSKPIPSGATETYLSGPLVRLTPDGRSLFIQASIDEYVFEGGGEAVSDPMAWTMDVDPDSGSFGEANRIPWDPAEFGGFCYWGAWLSNDEYLASCGNGGQTATFARLDRDGRVTGRTEVQIPAVGWFDGPVLDRANHRVLWWAAVDHLLIQVDLDSGTTRTKEIDPDRPAAGAPPQPSPGRRPPDWQSMTSDYRPWNNPTTATYPGSERLYLVGMKETRSPMGGGGYGSTGIWVVDAGTDTVVAHWPADVAYQGIGLSRDGRWLLGLGIAGMDANGEPTKWSTSLWVYDVEDGRVALRLGHLGEAYQAMIVPI